jgi:hypothetical protein
VTQIKMWQMVILIRHNCKNTVGHPCSTKSFESDYLADKDPVFKSSVWERDIECCLFSTDVVVKVFLLNEK